MRGPGIAGESPLLHLIGALALLLILLVGLSEPQQLRSEVTWSFPSNHRPASVQQSSTSRSIQQEINSLVTEEPSSSIIVTSVSSNSNSSLSSQERLTSVPDRISKASSSDSPKRRHRPGMVTHLGVISVTDEPLAPPPPSGVSRGLLRVPVPPSSTTTEVYLVTSPFRPTKPSSNNNAAKSGSKNSKSKGDGTPVVPLLRQEAWVLPLLVLSAITLLTMAAFEVFVLCRASRAAPSRRHLFLGQMLLLGVFLCVSLAALQAATPNAATCAVARLGVGLSYALVFAALLVKSVFLISLNGGVYLPAPYQALLLLFAVLIQVAVGAQWLLNSPPRVQQPKPAPVTSPNKPIGGLGNLQVITASDITPSKDTVDSLGVVLCETPYSEQLAALVYVVFLMGFVGVLAAKSRGIRENYREATYIGLSIACCAPLWLGWALAGLAVAPRHQDACVGFGLLATGAVVFSLMFLPRGRQLAAMGRDGRYAEDGGEERFSSLSPSAVAGYSPSFFHFKPAPAHTLPAKHGLFPAQLMGDRVALVGPSHAHHHPQHLPPPPPSYPRLLHYYPCLYYPPRYPGLYMKPDDGNMYTTLEPTMSSNPNVFFQRGGIHPGMMY